MEENSAVSIDLEALKARHSVRAYADTQIDENILKELTADITMINTHEAGMHFEIVQDDPDPFRSFSKSYGVFRGVRNYLACIVDTSFPDYMERAGFYAEKFAVKASALGLGTCFIGGTYNAGSIPVQLRVNWKVLFVVVFGNPTDKERPLAKLMKRMVHRKDPQAEAFFAGGEDLYEQASRKYDWLGDALEAVACAPSALNKRPVRVTLKKTEVNGVIKPRLCAYVDDTNPKNLIDLGIAKYNLSVVSPIDGIWEWGNGAPFIQD